MGCFNHSYHVNFTYFKGGKIWCDIVSNVEAQSELMASFTFGNESEMDENISAKSSDDVMDHEEMKLQIDIKEEITDEPPAEAIKENATVTSPTKHQNNHGKLQNVKEVTADISF